MLKNGRTDATGGLAHDGCSCCNSPRSRQATKKGAKAKEKKAALRRERTAN